jgi:protein phosphatase PTC6
VDTANGDPQVFYFGVFDGHGGTECSGFLREGLHQYIEDAAKTFALKSSLGKDKKGEVQGVKTDSVELRKAGQERLDNIKVAKGVKAPDPADSVPGKGDQTPPPPGEPPLKQESACKDKIIELEKDMVNSWKELVGGYFRRFRPAHFSLAGCEPPETDPAEDSDDKPKLPKSAPKNPKDGTPIEEVMAYAFLKADLDFISAQASKREDIASAEKPLNEDDILGLPHQTRGQIGGPKRFKGGSTCSVAMISTPTPTPFWHPATPSSLLVSHVGDTRILLCSTATGFAIPMTTDHHPSSPVEANRLRRFAATFVTDSFGEERMAGLANTRAFGDIQSKRLGVSAEPEIRRVELAPAEYSFMVLVSDGISGTLIDQEIVDIVKEAKTPEQAARDVVSFAVEVSAEGDNATCLVVRLGGWERRQEGGLGSLGTKESRDWRREAASDPRSRQQ